MATLLFTWAAIYAYVGVYFCTLHVRRPSHREYLAFGLLSFGLAIWSAGSALAADAVTLDAALVAHRVELVGGFAATALFVHFAAILVDREDPWTLRLAYGVALVGLAADAAGLLHDGAVVDPTGIAVLPAMVQPDLTWLGVALLGATLVLCIWAVFMIAQAARTTPDLRALVWATGIATVGGVLELLQRATDGQPLFLLDHAAMIPILTVSFLLQRRFLRAADELGDRTAELRRSYSELRVVQEELVRREQLAAVGELSAVIAHEVRNPLAIIKNAVSGLRRPTLRPADRGVLLAILEEEVDRLNRLVRNLLDYARPVAPQSRAVDLPALAREAAEAARHVHERPESVHIIVTESDAPPVHGDPDLLRQALTNVAANAMQAMPDGGTLTIRATEVAGPIRAVCLEIEDTGNGMSEGVLVKAKDPFFTTRPAGTGLGLAIVERVLRNHGGSVTLRSTPDAGTTAVITVPCERASAMPGEGVP